MDVLLASAHVFRRELSAYVLSEAGYRVREFSHSDGLLYELRQSPPDLLILDFQLLPEPELTQVRAYASSVQLPLLLLRSNSSYPLSLTSAEQSIQWPYQQAEFLASVEALQHMRDAVAV
jgi:DNA-binding response OmpR family regulator